LSSVKLDFLRQIANPLIDEYVRNGVITARDAVEVKKRFFHAEGKYGFNTYIGDPSKLSLFLNSRDFDELAEYLKSLGALQLILDILSRIEEVYRDLVEVVDAARKARDRLSAEQLTTGGSKGVAKCLDLESLSSLIREKLNPSELLVEGNTVKALIGGGVEFSVSLHKQHVKIVIKAKKGDVGRAIKGLFEKVGEIAEKTLCI